MQLPKRKAIFLDRDGVLNVDLGYTYKPNDLKLVDGMIDGLKSLTRGDYAFVMLTNQSGIARGMFTAAQVESFNNELLRQIQCEIPNFKFDAVMICPHHPEGLVPEFTIDCECRKPGIKLVTEAATKLNLDLGNSWIIGDKDTDIECAINAGMRGIQVTRGGKQYSQSKKAFAITPTLREAAEIILKH